MFPASQRGLGMSLFASAPFLGPVIGPIVGGFMGETVGWRWVEGTMAIFTGVLLVVGALTIPETYPTTILHRRARALEKRTGKKYISVVEKRQGKITFVCLELSALVLTLFQTEGCVLKSLVSALGSPLPRTDCVTAIHLHGYHLWHPLHAVWGFPDSLRAEPRLVARVSFCS